MSVDRCASRSFSRISSPVDGCVAHGRLGQEVMSSRLPSSRRSDRRRRLVVLDTVSHYRQNGQVSASMNTGNYRPAGRAWPSKWTFGADCGISIPRPAGCTILHGFTLICTAFILFMADLWRRLAIALDRRYERSAIVYHVSADFHRFTSLPLQRRRVITTSDGFRCRRYCFISMI